MDKNPVLQDRSRVEPLLKWLKDTPREVAERRCSDFGTSVGYLKQIGYGNKLAGLIGADIERITDGAVTRRDLRPDDWQRVWPELAQPIPQAQGEAAHV